MKRYLEDDEPSNEEGNPANFDIDEISGNDGMQGTDYKVRQKFKCLQRNKITSTVAILVIYEAITRKFRASMEPF